MDNMLLKRAAIQSVALMFAVISLSFALHQYRSVVILASGDENTVHPSKVTDYVAGNENDALTEEEAYQYIDILGLKEYNPALREVIKEMEPELYKQLGEKFLIIKKPAESNTTIHIDELYIKRSLRILLQGLNTYDEGNIIIGRANHTEGYFYEPVIKELNPEEIKTSFTVDFGNKYKDIAHAIITNKYYNEDKKNYAVEMIIELDQVYVPTLYEDDNYYYINLKRPREVYDKIVVIDPGHGGSDAGAISITDNMYEKDINLDITLHLKELLDKENIKVYYTRLVDEKLYLRPRVTLANEVESDFFISIHCNSNEVSSPNGMEILYMDTFFNGISSRRLADTILEELSKSIPLKKRGLILKKQDDIFILDKSTVPAVLVEVGYLSNSNDFAFLKSSANRKEAARGIYNGIMKAYEEYEREGSLQ